MFEKPKSLLHSASVKVSRSNLSYLQYGKSRFFDEFKSYRRSSSSSSMRVMSFANISASLASLKVAIFVLKYTKSAPRVYGFSLMSVLTFVSQRSSSLSVLRFTSFAVKKPLFQSLKVSILLHIKHLQVVARLGFSSGVGLCCVRFVYVQDGNVIARVLDLVLTRTQVAVLFGPSWAQLLEAWLALTSV